MKTRILLAALVLAAACAPADPTAPELSEREIRARNNGGYIGSGNRQEVDSARVSDSGYIGSGNRTEVVATDPTNNGS